MSVPSANRLPICQFFGRKLAYLNKKQYLCTRIWQTMILRSLNILNYKNIREADIRFSDKINCFVGKNGQGKTNLLDAIYYLSFCKSAFNSIDSQNITHDADFCMIQGEYEDSFLPSLQGGDGGRLFTCVLKRGQKKQFRRGKKDYKRLIDHIGLIPLVMVSPQDAELIDDGSDARRKFMDGVISQYDRPYLEHLTDYNAIMKQRNALLKQYADTPEALPEDLMQVFDLQMVQHALYIYRVREKFIQAFTPYFQEFYRFIVDDEAEIVSLKYVSQLQDRDMLEAMARTRQRDLILGWTSQGIHKDELEMLLGEYPLKRVGSQGQQKTYLLALKLAQACMLQTTNGAPILLLDDIFDKLDSNRMERIVQLVHSERFGQIFITDTDRQHLTDILRLHTDTNPQFSIFEVHSGIITPME